MVALASWGRLECPAHRLEFLTDRDQVAARLQRVAESGIAYGMGRSYGDICLAPNGISWQTRGLDRFIAFDPVAGRLICEAGVLLRDIQRFAVPRGWMLPVTPGTQLVTVGGAIANDVHGKNHHVFGAFGNHVLGLRLARTDGSIIDCGPQMQPDWFAATIGGMGLTGIVVTATLQLRPVPGPWLVTETVPFVGLDTFFELADSSEAEWEYTVSWIDCLSGAATRGLFMRGNHRAGVAGKLPHGKRRAVPFVPPISLVNRLSLRPFNAAYYELKQRQRGLKIEHYEPFFYPLDNLLAWNRIYGPKGFYQYQSVMPRAAGRDAIAAMLQAIAVAGEGSFLAVLKTFGQRESVGMMSFPQAGVTLALDFPNKGSATQRLFARLDAIVQEAGGRIYPAKDARMSRAMFTAGYPRLQEFLNYRDPGLHSAFSQRLMDPP